MQDGATSRDIQDLAKIGSNGRHPGKAHSQLVARLRPPSICSSISRISAFIRIPPARMVKVDQSIILPHEMFSTLYNAEGDIFTTRVLGGSADNVSRFWRDMALHPAFERHPLRMRADGLTRCVPISIHGDGVTISGIGKSWGKNVDVYSFTSCLSFGTTVDTNFLIFFLYPKLVIEAPGLNLFTALSKKLAWSLYWLFVGTWPLRDEDGDEFVEGTLDWQRRGRPLAGGFYATVWLIKADLEHMAKVWGFPYATSRSPCGLCRVNCEERPWADPSRDAAWTTTVWSAAEWVASHPDRNPLWKLPGVNIKMYVPDALHVLHLGAYMYFYGSILEYMTKFAMADTPENNLTRIWDKIKEYYSVTPNIAACTTPCHCNKDRIGFARRTARTRQYCMSCKPHHNIAAAPSPHPPPSQN